MLECGPVESDPTVGLEASGKFDGWGEGGGADIDPTVLSLALRAAGAARQKGYGRRNVLAVLDYSLPSSDRRLWVLDLSAESVLFRERAGHGRNSGDQLYAEAFSDREGSHMSSIGLYECAETGVGSTVGFYVALDGLEPGYNGNARRREILLHGSSYASDDFVERNGYVGRSLGCITVRPDAIHDLADTLAGGGLLFAYYPDEGWISRSAFLRSSSGSDAVVPPDHGDDLGGGTDGLCTNTCYYARDGECDDGGPDADWAECDYGTDCADCGAR